MNPAPNLVLVGPMGAGKTSLGKRLAERLGLQFADADRDIELRTGASVGAIFDYEGEAGFRARERAALAQLLAGSGRLIATGGGAVLDPDNRRQLRARGFVVWLQVDVAAQIERLARDRSRPLLQGDDRLQRLQRLAAERTPLYAQVADLAFDTRGLAVAEAAGALATLLQTHWRPAVAAGPTA